MFCAECGHKQMSEGKFCTRCGTSLAGIGQGAVPTSNTAMIPTTVYIPAASSAPSTQAPAPTVTNTLLVVGATKSVGLAILLALLFGPLGLLYASVMGGVVMFFVSLLIALVTFGFGILLTWPICVLWAAIAANSHNSALVSAVQHNR